MMRYIKTTYSSNFSQIADDLETLRNNIIQNLHFVSEAILERAINTLTDQNTWDPRYYRVGPQAGEPYDLDFSGQFLNALRTRYLHNVHDNGFLIGLGDIPYLDSLRSAKGYQNFVDRGVPYWRIIVWGRPPFPGAKAVWTGETWEPPIKPNKPVVWIQSGFGTVAGIKPSHMFENTLLAVEPTIHQLVKGALRSAIRAMRLP